MRRITYLLVITLVLFQIVSCKKDDTSETEISIYYKSKTLSVLDDATATVATFTAITDWYVSVDEKYSSWLSTDLVAGVPGSYNITLITTENDTFDSRTGYVTLCGVNQQNTITITQKGKQIIVFNDPNFEAFCIDNYDSDTSGYVTTAEAHKATELKCPSLEIADFSGIEFFTGITEADLSGNNPLTLSISKCVSLKKIDVSNCTVLGGLEIGTELKNLTTLDCSNCNLSSLSIDSCTLLTDFNCERNDLASLNLTNNISLKNLKCRGNDKLTSIFVTEDQEIESIEKDDFTRLVYPNEIVNIPDEIFRNYLLEEYDRNRDKKISVEEALDADIIRCFGKEGNISNISTLEGIEYFQNIVYLDCSYTSIKSLDLTCNPKLKDIICNSTKLEKILISAYSPLNYLDCSFCKDLTYLSLNKNSHLKTLYANNCNLEAIDFGFCSSLEEVHINGNRLDHINFTNTNALNYVDCSFNQINSMIIQNCDSLAFVFCQNNKLASLNICEEEIKDLNISNNNFSGEIDFSEYSSLRNVICDTNEISSIILPGNNLLYSISLNSNKLDSLDVSYMPEIKYVYATNNLLSNINTAYSEKLEKVIINDNCLKDTVDFSTNRVLNQVWLMNNPELKTIFGPKGVSPLEIRHDSTSVVVYK